MKDELTPEIIAQVEAKRQREAAEAARLKIEPVIKVQPSAIAY